MCSRQPFSATPLVSDSPVLCWAGCWATVSLLALCPMLRLLSPLACRALPLPRPAAGEQNLKPPRSSPIRHRALVTQDCLDCSLASFGFSCLTLPLPSACVIWSLPPFLPPSLKHKHTHSLSSYVPPFLELWLHKKRYVNKVIQQMPFIPQSTFFRGKVHSGRALRFGQSCHQALRDLRCSGPPASTSWQTDKTLLPKGRGAGSAAWGNSRSGRWAGPRWSSKTEERKWHGGGVQWLSRVCL